MLNLSRNRGTYDGAAFFQDDSGITEKKISLNRLISWENQPFEPYTDEAMATLAASIEENGLLSPIIVAPDGDKYRIIAGHNRVRACERLGWTEIPAVIKETDEDHAQLMMLDTNLCQRHNLSVVELIKAYKMQYDVLSRIVGKKDGYGVKKTMAEQYGLSRKTINRYIRCSRLKECLLSLLSEGRFSLITAVSLSDLSAGNQSVLADWLRDNPKAALDEKAAQRLVSRNGFGFDEDEISEIISGKTPKAKSKPAEIPKLSVPEDSAVEPAVHEKAQPAEPPTEPPQSAEDAASPEAVDYDDLPDVSVSFDRETIRRTIGEVDDGMVQEYLNFCLQQEDMFSKFLGIYKSGSST